ncbi:MAG: AI-2E family transporter [Erysipelotrichaceae bacterium]
MKIKLQEEHKSLALALLIVVIVGIGVNYIVLHIPQIKEVASMLTGLLFPFIIGFAIAFLLNKPLIWVETKVLGRWNTKASLKRSIAVVITLLIAIISVGLVVSIILPQIISSLTSLVDQAPYYIENFEQFMGQLMIEFNISADEISNLFGVSQQDVITQLTSFLQEVLPHALLYGIQLTTTIFNVVLGIMAGAYMMLDKERFLRYIRKTLRALFSNGTCDYLLRLGNRANMIFNDFIVGKAIDSAIIGVLCYVGMTIFNFPYAILISVIIGITNMIPVFGPFIGAVPGLIILTIINPINFIYFALFVLALQQLDGNIIGPIILGDKLGLPSLFILFAVVVGGGLFGIVGMFIGVPLFALLASIIKEFLQYRAKQRNIAL